MRYERLLAGATALGTVLALSTGTAHADYTSRILDAPLISPTYSRIETWDSSSTSGSPGTPANNWGDELGGAGPFDGFRSGAIDVTWESDGDLRFTLYTNFGLSGATVGGLFVGFADIFIDLSPIGPQATPSWDYAIDIKSESAANTSPDAGGSNLARLVASPTYATSQDVLKGTGGLQYGGLTNICAGSDDTACQTNSRAPETKVTNGSGAYDLDVTDTTGAGNITLTGPNGSETYGAAYSITIEATDLAATSKDWTMMRVFWGTGWCANDTVEGVAMVPIPAALPMLLAAVGGLGLAARRARRTA
jgi:hypothetical protein